MQVQEILPLAKVSFVAQLSVFFPGLCSTLFLTSLMTILGSRAWLSHVEQLGLGLWQTSVQSIKGTALSASSESTWKAKIA